MNRRPSMMPPSRASLAPNAQSKQAMAAELERTEQNITIALQEIDRNFARANKIVGESILPVIERYAQQSKTLWSGAEFWKQFLESAANVKLSGYEENVHQDTDMDWADRPGQAANDVDDTTTTAMNQSSQFESELMPIKSEHNDGEYFQNELASNNNPRNGNQEEEEEEDDEFTPHIQSTPQGKNHHRRRSSSPTKIPRPTVTTPKLTPRKDDDYDISDSILDAENNDQSHQTPSKKSPTKDTNKNKAPTPRSVLRHQVLDKNWGIQATPIAKKLAFDDDFSLSPDIQPPKSNLLDSPKDVSMSMATPQKAGAGATYPTDKGSTLQNTPKRTPLRTNLAGSTLENNLTRHGDLSDSDIDMMSPPVTMHFAGPNLVTNQDLVKTPARQAAKTIVDDILRDVGDESESINASITKTQYNSNFDYLLDDEDRDNDSF